MTCTVPSAATQQEPNKLQRNTCTMLRQAGGATSAGQDLRASLLPPVLGLCAARVLHSVQSLAPHPDAVGCARLQQSKQNQPGQTAQQLLKPFLVGRTGRYASLNIL